MAKKRRKKAKKKKNKGGRPAKYTPEHLRQARILAEKGLTDKEIAKVFGVKEQTINNWKKKFPHFFESLKAGKEIADSKVVQALYERACGYEREDTYFATHKGRIISKTYIKHYPPDTTACIFWLKNRQPDKWRDKQQHEHSGNITLAQAISNLDDEDE